MAAHQSASTRLISTAVSSGAPAYNSGNISKCVSIYAEAAGRLLNEYSSELTSGVASALAAALEDCNAIPPAQQAEGSAAGKLAWSFRRAFDAQMAFAGNSDQRDLFTGVEDLISNAVARGAPAYNRGAIGDCVQIYSETAQQLLRRGDLSKDSRRSLEDALSQGRNMDNSADSSAWAFRKALDSIGRLHGKANGPAPRARSSQTSIAGTGAMIRNFSLGAGLDLQASCVNDTVMGGRSSSSVRMTSEGALFEGTVTKRGGGGFANVRFQANDRNALAQALLAGNGIACSVRALKGCASWKLQLNEGMNGVQWQAGFVASRDIEQVVRLPYKLFFPTWRGQLQGSQGIPKDSLAEIQDIGFSLSFLDDDGSTSNAFEEGQFALLIKWIASY